MLTDFEVFQLVCLIGLVVLVCVLFATYEN
jgi:hypothetical protein